MWYLQLISLMDTSRKFKESSVECLNRLVHRCDWYLVPEMVSRSGDSWFLWDPNGFELPPRDLPVLVQIYDGNYYVAELFKLSDADIGDLGYFQTEDGKILIHPIRWTFINS